MHAGPELKIQIQNFGPIRDFDFNVRDDFVLIVGPNNVGKSYAISVVYLTLKAITTFSRGFYAFDFLESPSDIVDSTEELLKHVEEERKRKKDADIDITKYFYSHLSNFFQLHFLSILQDSLLGTFNDLVNLQNKLSNEPARLILRSGGMAITIEIGPDGLSVADLDLDKHRFFVRGVRQNRTVHETTHSTIVYFPHQNPSQFEENYRGLVMRLFTRFVRSFAIEIADLHYLPASRSGLYQALSAFGQIVAELAKNRTMLSRKIELPGISEPLSDYFLKLSEARPTPSDSPTPFQQIAERIEKDILFGSVGLDTKSKRLTYSPHNMKLQLDLSATSSMVSEISPIVSYLKFVLPLSLKRRRSSRMRGGRAQIVIIEEPEAHLHPEVQRRLVEIFAELVKTTDTKLVMTSHSNYIFNELSNLVIAHKVNADTFRAVLFKKTSLGTTAHNLEVSELGIEDENFVDTAEAIYRERLELLSEQDNNKK